jgi:uncharacterized phage protein gp47/JayE
MPIFADSKQNIFSDILNDVLSNTNITRSSPGTKTRAIVEAVSNKVGDVWTKFDLNMAHAFLNGAEGKYLDYFADMFGIQRQTELPAAISSEDRVVKFYRVAGDTSDTIQIPQGTVISSRPNSQGVSYVTTTTAALNASLLEVYVSARSRQSGRKGNVGRDMLVNHDVTVDAAVTSKLLVTNEADITTGRGLESDDNFRFRIANQVLSAETGNLTAIRMKALSVPGVADVEIFPFHRGVGTFDVLIKSTSPSVTPSLINNVRQALYFTVAQGVSFNVRKPKETGVSIELTISLRNHMSEQRQSILKKDIQGLVFDYLDNLDIGQPLLVNELTQRIMNMSDNISTMGTAGKPIDSITVYKETALSETKIPETLFAFGGTPQDYYPASDEKLITELKYMQTENPIVVAFT